MPQWAGAIVGLLVASFLTGCIISRHPAGIAASSAPLTPSYTVLGPVEDSSCLYQFLIIPIGAMDGPDDIMSRLVKERGADGLIGVTVELRTSTFALPVVASTCTLVQALAVKNVR